MWHSFFGRNSDMGFHLNRGGPRTLLSSVQPAFLVEDLVFLESERLTGRASLLIGDALWSLGYVVLVAGRFLQRSMLDFGGSSNKL